MSSAPRFAGATISLLLVSGACRLDVPVAADYATGSSGLGDSTTEGLGTGPDSTSSEGTSSEGTSSESSSSMGEPESSSGEDSTSTTTEDPVCGDDVQDVGEDCDGTDLGGRDCMSEGFDDGTLGCAGDCTVLDTSACITFSCGNDVVEGVEACDGADLAGSDCVAQGFDAGTLGCLPDCSGFETSACIAFSCGNDLIEGVEACDGADLAGGDCVAQGFDAGTLGCLPDCTGFDTSACITFTCGNDITQGVEVCDGADLVDNDCLDLGFDGGALGCAADCATFDTSACISCGDGVAEGVELCDGFDLLGNDCLDVGFDGGMLACDGSCDFDTAGCTVCGDGLIEGAEQCEGGDLDGQTCQTRGFEFGTLGCSSDCAFDDSGCTNCGNDVIDAGETCDGADLSGSGCTDLGMGFAGGTLACDATCAYELSGCIDHPLPAQVLVTEIMKQPSVPVIEVEWFEVFNPTATTLELRNCLVEGSAGEPGFTIDIDLPIGPMQYRVFAADLGVAQGFVPDYQWPSAEFGLANDDDDTVRLVCDAMTVDEVTYDDATFPDLIARSMSLSLASYDAIANDVGANWCAASNDYNGDFGTPGAANPVCVTDLYFSEYMEGSSNNKALEIYNPSGLAVDLGTCEVQIHIVGSPVGVIGLSGVVAGNDVFVVCDDNISDSTNCDLLSAHPFFYNGNDAVVLVCDSSTFDVIGEIGFDPGTEWLVNGVGTQNETLRRSCAVTTGDANGADPFDPSLEWISFSEDIFDDLGQYVCP